jgi:ATP-dependent Clp protease ATP-binding subunit ClpC
MRDKEKQAKEKLEGILAAWRNNREEKRVKVDEEDIVPWWPSGPASPGSSGWSRIRVPEAARHGEGRRSAMVIGQQEAVAALSRALRRSRADLKDPRRPIGTFMLLGPTGVGKTLLAKALAEHMFGDPKALVQLDMSEYMEKFSVSRLVGSPPGYVGYEEGGQLTEKVRRKPYCVVLFDEMEKAHPDVMNMLLQILEEGKLTDSSGPGGGLPQHGHPPDLQRRRRDDQEGQRDGLRRRRRDYGADYDRMREKLLEESKRVFKPEFLNRLDDVIVFRSLTGRPRPRSSIWRSPRCRTRPAQETRSSSSTNRPRISCREGLRSAVRRAPDAPGGGALPRGPAGRGDPARPGWWC